MINDCLGNYPLQAIHKIRHLLCIGSRYPINKLIKSGVISRIISLLSNNKYDFKFLLIGYMREAKFDNFMPVVLLQVIKTYIELKNIDYELQVNGRWILTNVAAGTFNQTNYIIEQNAIPILLNGLTVPMLLNCRNGKDLTITRISIEALSNIAGNDISARNLLLENNILPRIEIIINQTAVYYIRSNPYDENKQEQILYLFRAISDLICNLSYGFPIPHKTELFRMIDILSVLKNYKDKNVFEKILHSFAHISKEFDDDIRRLFFTRGFIRICVDCFLNEFKDLMYPAITCIGNHVNALDDMYLIQLRILPKCKEILENDCNNFCQTMRKKVCWMISNIVDESNIYIELLTSSKIMKILLTILSTECYAIARESMYVICNSIICPVEIMCTNNEFKCILDHNIAQHLFSFMHKIEREDDMITLLKGIINLFRHGLNHQHENNIFVQLFKNSNGFIYLKQLICKNNIAFITINVRESIKCIINEWN